MKAFVRARGVSKVFALAEKGGGPVSLLDALRAGKRETVHREIRALDEVSFAIEEGERVGIIGRNGAGKTTLLSMIAGITEPTFGALEIGGDVHAMLTIGTVLREEATGRENVYLDGAIHGKTRADIDAHLDDIIAFAELGEFIDRPVRTYSSGMKARLAFAMGAFIDPDVFILDETLAVGDVFFAEKALKRMKEITAKGRIVILVSHSLGSIVEMCDRCLWLDQGRLVMDGSPKEVTDAYQAAVQQSDEAQLAAKFTDTSLLSSRPEVGSLKPIVLRQGGVPIPATARAFQPLDIVIAGEVRKEDGVDLEVSITRVDGRRILSRRHSRSGGITLKPGVFTSTMRFEPLILGADLYRIDCALVDAGGVISIAHRVVEIIDEEGQFGGKPLLFCSPLITTSAIEEFTQ
jgi:lipopolysaccharide transport system ATP-binding protein